MPDIIDLSRKNSSTAPQKQEVKPVKQQVTTPSTPASIHSFTSFCLNPSNIHFNTQESDEKVYLFLRRHFITNLRWILLGIIFFLLPFLLLPLLRFADLSSFLSQTRYELAFFLFYYLVLFTYLFVEYITWYYNISLVTTHRIVDIDYSDVVYKNVAATKLDLVEDISFTQVGVFPTFFDFGDILVQTAGELENFDFNDAPHPARAVAIIEDFIGKGGQRA